MKLTEDIMDIIIILFGLALGFYSSAGFKSQFVRLIDIFLYGPFLIFCAYKMESIYFKYILFIIGASTISYNFKNYITTIG